MADGKPDLLNCSIKVDTDLVLSTLDEPDLPRLCELAERNASAPFFDWYGTKDAVAAYLTRAREQASSGRQLPLGVRLDGELVGVVSLSSINGWNESAGIDYWLSRDRQGNGVITRSCRAVVRYAFETLKLHRLTLVCATENEGSMGVAQRLGFTREGTMRQAEKISPYPIHAAVREKRGIGKDDRAFFDHAAYALLADEWRRAINDK